MNLVSNNVLHPLSATQVSVVRPLVTPTKSDFLNYFASSEIAAFATQVVAWAKADDSRLAECAIRIEAMIPDTEQVGVVLCS